MSDETQTPETPATPLFAFQGFRTKNDYTAAREALGALAQGESVILTGSDNAAKVEGILEVSMFQGHTLVTDEKNETAKLRANVRYLAAKMGRTVEYAAIAGIDGATVASVVRFGQ